MTNLIPKPATKNDHTHALSTLLLGSIFSVLTFAAPTAFAAEKPNRTSSYHTDQDGTRNQNVRNGQHIMRAEETIENRRDRRDNARDRHNDRRDTHSDRRDRRNNRWEGRGNYRRDHYRRDNYRRDRHWRDQRRRDYRRRDYRRNNYRYNNYGYTNYGYNNYGRYGYRTNYRSSLGINFVFGDPGYSSYRWASTPYSFYQPGNWSYSNYYNSVSCQRITVMANHHGHSELISVNQCYNPIDGYYIIQGSERIIDCPYG